MFERHQKARKGIVPTLPARSAFPGRATDDHPKPVAVAVVNLGVKTSCGIGAKRFVHARRCSG